jgi:hypothetical protein
VKGLTRMYRALIWEQGVEMRDWKQVRMATDMKSYWTHLCVQGRDVCRCRVTFSSSFPDRTHGLLVGPADAYDSQRGVAELSVTPPPD